MRPLAVRVFIFGLVLVACSEDSGVRSESDLTRLSSRGLYSDIAARKVVPEALEYRPDYALWSDGADKRRWIILPEGARIDTSDMAHWVFPLGTKFFKEFSHDGKLLETRLVERVKETGFLKNDYFMGTFIWRADQSDAILSKDGRDNVLGTEHDVPKQKACIVCHQGEPGAVLGFSAVQLSASGTLRKIARKKWLSDAPEQMPEWPGDDVQKRALGVMHANCGHCHSETGMADFMHLRFLPEQSGLPFAELDAYKTTVGVELSDEWEDHPPQFERRVVPGDPDASAIAYRMGTRGDDELVPDQMPPLATRKVDEEGLAAVRAWIVSLAGVETPDAGVADSGEGDASGADAAVGDAGALDAGAGSEDRDAGGLDAGKPPAADGGGPAVGGGAGRGGQLGPVAGEPPLVQGAAGAAVGGEAGGAAGAGAAGGGEVAGAGGAGGAAGADAAGAGAAGAAGAASGGNEDDAGAAGARDSGAVDESDAGEDSQPSPDRDVSADEAADHARGER
jgi:hypothetical protein